jgi:hypothetical protein
MPKTNTDANTKLSPHNSDEREREGGPTKTMNPNRTREGGQPMKTYSPYDHVKGMGGMGVQVSTFWPASSPTDAPSTTGKPSR